MIHAVANKSQKFNTMMHDVFNYDFNLSIKSTEIAALFQQWLIQDTAVAFRIKREQQGGRFGDPEKHPYVWAVALYVDGLATRVHNARGQGREWASLDKVEVWLREIGISRRQVVNTLEDVTLKR